MNKLFIIIRYRNTYFDKYFIFFYKIKKMEIWCKIEKKRTKFILAFISAIMFQFGSSVILASGSFAVYFLSYIHYKDDYVSMQYGNIMSPIIYLFLSAFSPLSGIIVRKIGPRLTFLLSSTIVEICLIGFYFQRNLWIFYVLSLLVGVGNGFSCGAPLNNGCRFYPKKKGIIGAIILGLGGLSNSLYSYVGEKLVNPDKVGIINRKTNPYYPENVAKKSKNYFILALCVVPVTTALTQLFYYKYDISCEKENNNENNNNVNNNVVQNNQLNKMNTNTNVKEILSNFRFWKIMIIVCLMPFWVYFLSSTYRAYVSMIGLNTTLISFISPLVAFITAVFGVIWAFFIDKFGFKPTIKVVSIICIVCSVYFIFVLKHTTLYYIGLLVSTTVARNAIVAVTNPHIMQIYEMRNFLFIGGFARLFNQLVGFIAGMVSIIISLDHKNADQLQKPYKIVAIVGVVLSVLGFVFTFFEGDDKFVFKNNEKNDEKDAIKDVKVNNDNNNNNKQTILESERILVSKENEPKNKENVK